MLLQLIFQEMIQSKLYQSYMNSTKNTFNKDKLFIVDLFKEIVAPNEKLYDYLEDKNSSTGK